MDEDTDPSIPIRTRTRLGDSRTTVKGTRGRPPGSLTAPKENIHESSETLREPTARKCKANSAVKPTDTPTESSRQPNRVGLPHSEVLNTLDVGMSTSRFTKPPARAAIITSEPTATACLQPPIYSSAQFAPHSTAPPFVQSSIDTFQQLLLTQELLRGPEQLRQESLDGVHRTLDKRIRQLEDESVDVKRKLRQQELATKSLQDSLDHQQEETRQAKSQLSDLHSKIEHLQTALDSSSEENKQLRATIEAKAAGPSRDTLMDMIKEATSHYTAVIPSLSVSMNGPGITAIPNTTRPELPPVGLFRYVRLYLR